MDIFKRLTDLSRQGFNIQRGLFNVLIHLGIQIGSGGSRSLQYLLPLPPQSVRASDLLGIRGPPHWNQCPSQFLCWRSVGHALAKGIPVPTFFLYGLIPTATENGRLSEQSLHP